MKYLSLLIIIYSASGFIFFKSEVNQNLLSNHIPMIQRTDSSESDSSGFSSDGPVIIYEDGKIVSYSVTPDKDNFKVNKQLISKSDKLECYIDGTDKTFTFQLKEYINTESDEYELPDKMLIVSDIEGNFNGFYLILKGAGVINEEFEWIFGNGHLVLNGDFFDRGINVTECLWLIYKLETEAQMKGGKVHFILGNHEVMNLSGNFRYVRKKYFANADSMNLNYIDWYGLNSELGKWLRSKNSMEKIGDYIFLHGGIRKDFPTDTFSLTEINIRIRESIDKTFMKGEASKDLFIGGEGPLWYRGIVKETETQEDVERTLSSFNSEKMILGHTIVDRIKYLYNQRIIAIDLDHQENTVMRKMYALWFENGNFFIIDQSGLTAEID